MKDPKFFDAFTCLKCQGMFPSSRLAKPNSSPMCTTCAGASCIPITEHPQFVANPLKDGQLARGWITAIGMIHFDLAVGQSLEYLYPPLPLSSAQETELAFLCFPDANFVSDGDYVHDFVFAFDEKEFDVTRASARRPPQTPLSKTRPGFSADSTELYCSALFRQRKDSSIQRGAQQKALVILSRFPLPSALHAILQILKSVIYDSSQSESSPSNSSREGKETLLQEAFDAISMWPRPLPGHRYTDMPLFNSKVDATTPWFTPQEYSKLHFTSPVFFKNSSSDSLSSWLSPFPTTRAEELLDSLESEESTLSEIQASVSQFAATCPWSKALLSNAGVNPPDFVVQFGAFTSDKLWPEQRMNLIAQLRGVPFTNLSEKEPCSASEGLPSCKLLGWFRRGSALHQGVAALQNAQLRNLLREATLVSEEAKKVYPNVSRCSSDEELHLFADVDITRTLFPHLSKLYKFWELGVIGAPLCVIGADHSVVSAACLSLFSLIAPLRPVGVLRPYLTINNREVDHEVHRADSGVIFGATNPFFVRHCESWPHLLCIASLFDDVQTHKTLPADSEQKQKSQFKLKNRMFCSRHYLVKTEKSIADSVAPIDSSSPTLSPIPTGTTQTVFRRTFTELTTNFLEPLKRHVWRILVTERPFFQVDVLNRCFSKKSFLEAVQVSSAAPINRFKTQRDMLQVYEEFMNTPTFQFWLECEIQRCWRTFLLNCTSIEDVLFVEPVSSARAKVLTALQRDLERLLRLPIVDVDLVVKLTKLLEGAAGLRAYLAAV